MTKEEAWIRKNKDCIKLVDDSESISEKIVRWKKNGVAKFSIPKEEFGISEVERSEESYCKMLDRFMEYNKVDGGIDILGKPVDCPLQAESEK